MGAVGRLVAEKGYPELFEGFAVAQAEAPQLRLAVVGPRDEAKGDSLDPAVVAAAEERGVLFLGHRTDMAELYSAMDLYVLASHREGFPRSAMEAAAMALPVIATDIRGCRQVVDDGVSGLLVPVRDSGAMARAFVDLATDAGRRSAMSQAARAKAQIEFGQARVIELTLDLYERLLAESSPITA